MNLRKPTSNKVKELTTFCKIKTSDGRPNKHGLVSQKMLITSNHSDNILHAYKFVCILIQGHQINIAFFFLTKRYSIFLLLILSLQCSVNSASKHFQWLTELFLQDFQMGKCLFSIKPHNF